MLPIFTSSGVERPLNRITSKVLEGGIKIDLNPSYQFGSHAIITISYASSFADTMTRQLIIY